MNSDPNVKFATIKKFTRMPNYRVTVDLKYLLRIIERYSKEDKLDFEPDFQRGWVWSVDQQIRYMEYLIRGGVSGREIYFNHPGWQGSYEGKMF